MSHVTLHRLRRALKKHGVRQIDVAEAAGVGRTMVVNLLAGRTKSKRVVAVAKRLLAEAKA